MLFFIYLGSSQAGGAVPVTFPSVCLALCCSLLFQDTWLGTQREFLVLGGSSSRNYKITTNPERIFTIFRIRAIRTSIYLGFFFSVGLNLEFLRAGQ